MTEVRASYRAAGVDYEALDAGKRLAITKALSTSPLLARRGGRALDASRGEPAFVFELAGRSFAFVVEGLGTKSLIARQVLERQGINRFADLAYDTVAAILNDLCCVGALPLVVNAYFATGASDWYRDGERASALLEGWSSACSDAGCAWGGGESPSLPGLVGERDIELAGAAVGAVPEGRSPILGAELQRRRRDRARGLQWSARQRGLARPPGGRAAERRLRDGAAERRPRWERPCWSRRSCTFRLWPRCLEAELEVTYMSHVTGHGLLKLMRPAKPLTYRIERLPEVPAGAELPGWARPVWTHTRRTRRSTWARAMPSTAPRAPARQIVRNRGGSGPERPARRARRGGSEAGDHRAGRSALRRGRARAVRRVASPSSLA